MYWYCQSLACVLPKFAVVSSTQNKTGQNRSSLPTRKQQGKFVESPVTQLQIVGLVVGTLWGVRIAIPTPTIPTPANPTPVIPTPAIPTRIWIQGSRYATPSWI